MIIFVTMRLSTYPEVFRRIGTRIGTVCHCEYSYLLVSFQTGWACIAQVALIALLTQTCDDE